MKAIKVNVDYEISLFEKKEPPRILNQTLEFLAFFLEEKPLFTTKIYSEDYLRYVEEISGNRIEIISKGDSENWWGSMNDIPLEQKLNSKELSAEFNHSQVVESLDQIKIEAHKTYVAKNPFGMSGQNIIKFTADDHSKLIELIQKSKKLIIEPFFDRNHDFSHYRSLNGALICYENLVDDNFQYKGTVFNDWRHPNIHHLSFYQALDQREWQNFERTLSEIVKFYLSHGAREGFSIDSFTFLEEGKIKIRALSEVNYRKTMGLIAWLFSKKFSGNNPWTLLVLGRRNKKENLFNEIKARLAPIAWNKKTKSGCLYLSPGDSRFEIFFLTAESNEGGKMLFDELKRLLPDCQFSVKI